MTLLTRDEQIRVYAAHAAARCEDVDPEDLIDLAKDFEHYIRTGNQRQEPA